MMTRSLSSPNSVVRNQIAPSASKMCPSSRSRADRPVDRAGLVQVVLVEVDVEVDAEVVQASLDLGEHQLDALARKTSWRLVVGQVEDAPGRGATTRAAISPM